mmetsp:Transcript_40102/g.123894  ORF Transcript_40102/g.123894 Transcript_40102/m.123894 type:complete len:280 (-) Transcript_40102:899-1738(-)
MGPHDVARPDAAAHGRRRFGQPAHAEDVLRGEARRHGVEGLRELELRVRVAAPAAAVDGAAGGQVGAGGAGVAPRRGAPAAGDGGHAAVGRHARRRVGRRAEHAHQPCEDALLRGRRRPRGRGAVAVAPLATRHAGPEELQHRAALEVPVVPRRDERRDFDLERRPGRLGVQGRRVRSGAGCEGDGRGWFPLRRADLGPHELAPRDGAAARHVGDDGERDAALDPLSFDVRATDDGARPAAQLREGARGQQVGAEAARLALGDADARGAEQRRAHGDRR